MKHNTFLVTSICIFAVVFIMWYARFRCQNQGYVDILNKRPKLAFIKNKKIRNALQNIFNGWAFTHIALFTIITYIKPDKYILFIILGIIWEIIEWIFRNILLANQFILYLSGADKHYNCKNKLVSSEPYWYSQYEDIISNCIGIWFGYLLSSHFKR